jgi:hypothetical protein
MGMIGQRQGDGKKQRNKKRKQIAREGDKRKKESERKI